MRHIPPNVMSPVMVSAALGVATAILTESALSFPPGSGSLLTLSDLGSTALRRQGLSHPGAPMRDLARSLISVTVMSVNFIGDGIRDALDPQTAQPLSAVTTRDAARVRAATPAHDALDLTAF